MSLVFGSREVAVGPTVGYKAGDGSPPAYVGKGHGQKGEEEVVASGVSCISALLKRGGDGVVERGGFCLDCKASGSLASSESSSIGAGEDSSGTVEKEGGEDEVQSKFNGGLGSMGSLEESLPIKRGLSNFFSGKSKSFASLSDASSVKDLLKAENPFNKRRRILLACKTQQSKKAFCSPLNISMPNFALEEDTVEEEGEEERKESSVAAAPIQGRKFKCFKSPRSFSFTDLGHA
ncbi:hypothetical protein AAC387_Pa05g2393 [Persea americana]